MANPSVKRGYASVEGVVGTFDVIVYPETQKGDLTQNFENEIVKDRRGNDCAERARNHHYTADFTMKLLGDTAANAKVGATLLLPLAIVTLAGFDAPDYNGVFSVQTGGKVSLVNTAIGDIDFKLKRYANADQNTLMTSVPG